MSNINEKLANIALIPSQKDKTAEYRSLLENILPSTNDALLADSLEAFVEHIVQEQVGLVISRQVLSDFVQGVDKISNPEIKKRVLHFALNKVQPRVVSFEEQVRCIFDDLFNSLIIN
jgi:COP9 signalosome complex subunit 4